MEKLQSMVTDFVERVAAFVTAQSQVNTAVALLVHLRGLLTVMEANSIASVDTIGKAEVETAIAEQEQVTETVSSETRIGLTEAAQALSTLAKGGVFDDEPELKAAALKAVDDFEKASITVVPPVGKAARRAA